MVSTKEGTALGTMGKAVSAVRDGGWRLEVGTEGDDLEAKGKDW